MKKDQQEGPAKPAARPAIRLEMPVARLAVRPARLNTNNIFSMNSHVPDWQQDQSAQTYLQPHYGYRVFGNVYLSAGQG